jgi:hypothetical protein
VKKVTNPKIELITEDVDSPLLTGDYDEELR